MEISLPKKIQALYDNLRDDREALGNFKVFHPRYLKLRQAIVDADMDAAKKIDILRKMPETYLGRHFKRNMKSFFAKIADEGDKMVPRSEPTDTFTPEDNPRSSNDFKDSTYTEGLSSIKITKENKKMKISKQALTKLIKEELKQVLKEMNIGQDPKGNQGYANDPDMQWWYEQQAYKQAQAQKKAQRDEKMIELQNKLANIRKNKGLSHEELSKDPDAKKIMDEMEELLNQLRMKTN